MSQYYAGIDLAARSSWICIVDSHGEKKLSRKVSNDPDRIVPVLRPFLPKLSAVVESTFNWYWMVDFLQDLEIDVKLAHPLYLKAIAYAKVKTDQVDAHTLAQLLRMHYIPAAFIYPRELRPTRDMLRRRHRLVRVRAGMYRDLQLQLMKHNITTFGRNTIKQIDGRHLRTLLSHVHDRRGGMAVVHLIAALDEEIDKLDQEILGSVRWHKPVVRLKTLPGVGRILGTTIYYEVGQIHRFPSDKAFASYCRLAPTVAQSGTVTRQGKNRKQGNRYLKWAFSEAAQMAIQGYPTIREYFNRLLKKKKILAKSILGRVWNRERSGTGPEILDPTSGDIPTLSPDGCLARIHRARRERPESERGSLFCRIRLPS